MKKRSSVCQTGSLLCRMANILTYTYIGLPILIFMATWIKWQIAIPVVLILLYSFFMACMKKGGGLSPKSSDAKILMIVFLIICGWVYLSGIGGLVYQNLDHITRNQIFRSLVNRDWPVQITSSITGETRYMSYYIGFWLPPAVVGKVFGLTAGFIFQMVWAILGVFLVYIKISEYFGRYSIYPMLIFIFFSGLDIAGCALFGKNIFAMEITDHIENWSGRQFSSHMTQLFWVFNQAVYGWLLTMMILCEKDNRHSVLIWSCGLLECTFPFVGMIPFLGYKVYINFRDRMKNVSLKKAIRELLSVENILGGGSIGLISFFFLISNSAAGETGQAVSLLPSDVFRYLIFFFVEAGVYYIAILKYQQKNPLYYLSLAVLAICPLITVSSNNDFCMRASIPGLVVLCLLVTNTFFTTWKENRFRFAVLLAVFLIGCVTPVHEIFRTTVQTKDYSNDLDFTEEEKVLCSPNFSSSKTDSFFGQYLLK